MAATITGSGIGPETFWLRQLPSGKLIKDATGTEIARELAAAGVPGVSHEQGRELNARAFDRFLGDVEAQGAARAVAEWLMGARRP